MYKSDQPILVAIALTGCIQNDTVKLVSYGFGTSPILNCQCAVQINIFVRVKYQI